MQCFKETTKVPITWKVAQIPRGSHADRSVRETASAELMLLWKFPEGTNLTKLLRLN